MLKVITKIRTLFFPFNLFVDEVSQGANSMMWSSSSGPGGEGSGSFLSGGLAVKEGITSHAKQEIQRLKGRGRVVVRRWDRCLKVFLRDVRWRTRLELKELL